MLVPIALASLTGTIAVYCLSVSSEMITESAWESALTAYVTPLQHVVVSHDNFLSCSAEQLKIYSCLYLYA